MPARTNQINGKDTAAQAARDKKKQILVAVLLAGLMIAILTQPSEQDIESGQVMGTPPTANPVSANPMSATNSSSNLKAIETPEENAESLSQIRELSRIELAEIIRLELFAPEPQRRRSQTRIKSVQAIYGTSTDRAALVDQKIIRSGQPLPGGQRVLDITTDGIRLSQ